MTKKIVALSGDGIGPEIMEAGLQVLAAVADKFGLTYQVTEKDFGGAGIDAEGHPLPQSTLEAAKKADAILLAAIGSPSMIIPRFGRSKVCLLCARSLSSMLISVQLRFLMP